MQTWIGKVKEKSFAKMHKETRILKEFCKGKVGNSKKKIDNEEKA
jgi:hypothetical protein